MSGVRDSVHWFRIQRTDENGFVASAFVKNSKDISKNGEISIPDDIATKLDWKY